MNILTEKQARELQPDSDHIDTKNFFIIQLSFREKTSRAIVAASIYCPWPGGKHRPKHDSGFTDGWNDGYNGRHAYINALVYLRSTMGMWTSVEDIESWHDTLNVNANFQIASHFRSLAGKNTDNEKYQKDNGWMESNRNGWVRATKTGLQVYSSRLILNHGSDW